MQKFWLPKIIYKTIDWYDRPSVGYTVYSNQIIIYTGNRIKRLNFEIYTYIQIDMFESHEFRFFGNANKVNTVYAKLKF